MKPGAVSTSKFSCRSRATIKENKAIDGCLKCLSGTLKWFGCPPPNFQNWSSDLYIPVKSLKKEPGILARCCSFMSSFGSTPWPLSKPYLNIQGHSEIAPDIPTQAFPPSGQTPYVQANRDYLSLECCLPCDKIWCTWHWYIFIPT